MPWLAIFLPPANTDRPAPEALAQWALQFTPQVSCDGDEVLLLDLDGCLRLFHGLHNLLARLRAGLAALELPASIAIADTPLAARLLARNGCDSCLLFANDGSVDIDMLHARLAALPLQALELDPRLMQTLLRTGFSTLGDLLSMPASALARRYGRDFSHWLERLRGSRPDPRVAVSPPPAFMATRDVDTPIAESRELLVPMHALLDELETFLRQRQLATARLHWQLVHPPCSQRRERVRWSTGSTQLQRDGAAFRKLLALQLESLRLADGVERIRLDCHELWPALGRGDDGNRLLFPELAQGQARADAFAGLCDRLRTRMGRDACRFLQPCDDWLPEAAQRVVDGDTGDGDTDDVPVARQARPHWLLPEPQPIDLRAARPPRLHWHGKLEIAGGPERLQGGWWHAPWSRDYYLARHENGALLWIFHEPARQRWFVHGVFG